MATISYGTEHDPYVAGARSGTASYTAPGYQPSIAPSPTGQPTPSPFTYTPKNGNTGFSGYGFPTGTTTPQPTGSPYDPNQMYAGGSATYNEATGQRSPYAGFNMADFTNAFQSLAQGQNGSLDSFINSIFPALQQQFPDIQRFGSKGDKIRLPNGQTIDAVISAGAGGRGYNFSPETGGGDLNPWLAQFGDLGQMAIQRLLQPQEMNPVLQQAIGALTGLLNARDAGYEQFQGIANKRLTQLDQPAYTDAQRAQIATNFTDPLEAQRSARKQQVLERAAARGLGLSSGVLEQETQGVDRSFDQARTEGERQLALQEIAANEARQQEAVQIGQALASLSGKNLPTQLSAAGQLAGIGHSLQNDPIQNLLSAMGISSQLAGLPGQQLGLDTGAFQLNSLMPLQAAQSALTTLNNQPVPQADSTTSLISLLLGLSGQGENTYNNTLGQNTSTWSGLMSLLPQLAGLFMGNGGAKAPSGLGAGNYPNE